MKEYRISIPAWVTAVVRAENEEEAKKEVKTLTGLCFTVSADEGDGVYTEDTDAAEDADICLSPVGTISDTLDFEMEIDDEREID